MSSKPASSSPASSVRGKPSAATRVSKPYAEAELPTRFGNFQLHVYREHDSGIEHIAMRMGEVRGGHRVLVRVHSECFTSEVMHSLKCDCREQLDLALARIAAAGRGVLLYLRQEGRGIGLGNKIRAYALQQRGVDTVDANRMLGFADDLRDYGVARDMLNDLGIRSVELMTNNPTKVEALAGLGVCVDARREHRVAPTQHNRAYLAAKRERMGHLYELDKRDLDLVS